MNKNIKDMSLSEIETELIRLRNMESKFEKISTLFSQVNESKNPRMELNVEEEVSKTQKIKNTILELLSNQDLETSQILTKLIESGLLMPQNTKQGELDYNNLRSCLAVLKNENLIYREKEERGEPWKLKLVATNSSKT
jgi:hypothetical protein